MSKRMTALIVAGVLQLANSTVVFADEAGPAPGVSAAPFAFMLPINGTLAKPVPQEETKFQVMAPLPEGAQPPSDGQKIGALPAPNTVSPPEDVIIIDNDDAAVQEDISQNFKWEEIPDEQGKTHIQAGA